MPTVYCQCGESYQVVEQHYGRRIKCGRCGRSFEVMRPRDPEPQPFTYTANQQRNSYRTPPPPPRDPYRGGGYDAPHGDPYRNDPYRNAPPRGYDGGYRGQGQGYDEDEDNPRYNFREQYEQVTGFFTPKVRLYLFIAFAGLMLMAAGLMLQVMKPVGPSVPAGLSTGGGDGE